MTPSTKTTILLIAGDISGDFNTAKLAKSLLEKHPDWTLHGVGGPYLGAEVVKSPGGTWIGDTSNLTGMGIYASVSMYPHAQLLEWRMRKFAKEHRVDAAVLCDWGTFNCRQFGFFKKMGVPVLYYFPPGSWRRTGSGGLGIAKQVARIATPFEWSAQRLLAAGGNAEWVGHPMLETRLDPEKRAALRVEFGAVAGEKMIALMPGSRLKEIDCLGPRLAAVAEILRGKNSGTRFVVATPGHREKEVRQYFPEWVNIVPDRTADVLFASDAAVVKSGTSTLEAAVIGTPQVMVYDVGWLGRFEWILLWMWKKIPFIAMPNVILQRLAVRELIGLDCTAEKIANEITGLLEDESKRVKMAADYREIREKLGAALPKSATQRTAEILEELLAEKKTP